MSGSPEKSIQVLAAELQLFFVILAAALDRHAKRVNIARVSGGAVGAAGAVTTIVGIALLPVTLGVSTVLIAVGTGVGVAGGVTAGGAGIFQLINEKMKIKKAQATWEMFCKRLLAETQDRFPDKYRKLQNQNPDLMKDAATSAVALVSRVISNTLDAADVRRTAAAAIAPRAAALIIANVVLIGVSLVDIVEGAMGLYKKKGSKVGDYCRSLADSLGDLAKNGLTGDFF